MAIVALSPLAVAKAARTSDGHLSAHAAIVGGEPVVDESLSPSLAYIFDAEGETVGRCTGTVVSPRLILTAGHCTIDLASGYRVVTGTPNYNAAARQISAVSRVIDYPSYPSSESVDAALLVLTTPTVAPPVGLPTSQQYEALFSPEETTEGYIVGWGQTAYGHRDDSRLRYASVALGTEGFCAEQIERRTGEVYDGADDTCAVDTYHQATICRGDSGGPLLARLSASEPYLEVGIANAVFGACDASAPAIFTRTDRIAAWIQEQAAIVASQPVPPAEALPNYAGEYGATATHYHVAVDLASDGHHVNYMSARFPVRCQHGYEIEQSGEIRLASPLPVVTNRMVSFWVNTPSSRRYYKGLIHVHLRFDELGEAEGTIGEVARARSRRVGTCRASLHFVAADFG